MRLTGLGYLSCDGDAPPRPDVSGTWLELVTAPPSQVWTDPTREIGKLREQGETLAKIGRRFGLSAERVRQILSDECPALPALQKWNRQSLQVRAMTYNAAGPWICSSVVRVGSRTGWADCCAASLGGGYDDQRLATACAQLAGM
jgi:hypothetical protein